MYDSDTFLEILEEGQLKEAKKLLLEIGSEHFGPADEATSATISASTDLERLERMARRLAKASGWEDVLNTP